MNEIVFTESAPKPVGPYSQAVRAGDFVYCAGQIALDPKSGQMVGGGVAKETRQALDNLSAVLRAAGVSLNAVVKTTVFLTSMNDFQEMNEVYARFFENDPPARSAIAVKELPKGALVEVEAVAFSA